MKWFNGILCDLSIKWIEYVDNRMQSLRNLDVMSLLFSPFALIRLGVVLSLLSECIEISAASSRHSHCFVGLLPLLTLPLSSIQMHL